MTNSHRTKPISDDVSEITYSPRVDIQWSPLDNSGRITFKPTQYLVVSDEPQYVVNSLSKLGRNVRIDFSEILPRMFFEENGIAFVDPVSGIDLQRLSGAAIMEFIKVAFDTVYGEAVDDLEAAEAARVAAQAAANALAALEGNDP